MFQNENVLPATLASDFLAVCHRRKIIIQRERIIHSKEISVSNTNKPNLLTKVVSCFWIESSKSFLDQEFVQQRCQPPNRSDDNHFLTARVNDPVCVGLPPLIDMLTAAKSIGLQRALSIRKQALTAVIYNVRISGLE